MLFKISLKLKVFKPKPQGSLTEKVECLSPGTLLRQMLSCLQTKERLAMGEGAGRGRRLHLDKHWTEVHLVNTWVHSIISGTNSINPGKLVIPTSNVLSSLSLIILALFASNVSWLSGKYLPCNLCALSYASPVPYSQTFLDRKSVVPVVPLSFMTHLWEKEMDTEEKRKDKKVSNPQNLEAKTSALSTFVPQPLYN